MSHRTRRVVVHHPPILRCTFKAAWACAFALGLVHVAACGSTQQMATCPNPGHATPGIEDKHCAGVTPQVVELPTCDQGAPADDANTMAADGNMPVSAYGPAMYGSQGIDDDCKYTVTWHADPICKNQDVMFYVTPTYLADGGAVTGAKPRLEVFLNDTTPAPNTNQMATETGPGTYSVGPIRFDKPGRWTIRWHLFEHCTDYAQSSPHGHAAFYVTVP